MAALPSLRQLSYLVTLSETLHFTEAARRSFTPRLPSDEHAGIRVGADRVAKLRHVRRHDVMADRYCAGFEKISWSIVVLCSTFVMLTVKVCTDDEPFT